MINTKWLPTRRNIMGNVSNIGSKIKGIIGCILPFIYALIIQVITLLICSSVYGFILGVQLTLEGVTLDEIARVSSEKVLSGNFTLTISAIAAVISAIVFGIWYKRSFVKNRKVEIKKIFNIKIFLWLTLLGIGLQFFLIMVLNLIMSAGFEFYKDYENVINSLGMGNSIISFVYIVLIAPVTEELIFRGVIFEKSKKVFPFIYANLFQALLFGIMHANIVQSSYAFLLGLFLGFVCHKRKSIFTAIYLHFVINLAGVLPNILLSNETETQVSLNYPVIIVIALIFTAIVVFSTIKIKNDKSIEEVENDSVEIDGYN